jgi:hypothetical protein
MDLGFACMQGNSILCSSEVLNSGRQTYHLLPHSKPSGSNWETAQIGTHNMLAKSTATKPPPCWCCWASMYSCCHVSCYCFGRWRLPSYFLCCYREPLSNRDTFPTFFCIVWIFWLDCLFLCIVMTLFSSMFSYIAYCLFLEANCSLFLVLIFSSASL